MKNLIFAVGVIAMGLGLFACASTQSAVQKIDSAFDCRGICNRYQSCFNSKYDVGACEARCRETAGSDGDYRRRADKCNECITDKACSTATFSCAIECSSVVP